MRPAAVLSAETPDHPLGSSTEIAQLLADSINRLRRGQLDPRVANAMGYLASVLIRALEQGLVEERLANLHAILGKTGSGPEIFDFRRKESPIDEESNEPNKGH